MSWRLQKILGQMLSEDAQSSFFGASESEPVAVPMMAEPTPA